MSTNVAVSIWSPTDGNGEYGVTDIGALADTTGVFLADTTGTTVVDTAATFTGIPVSIWAEDDSQ